MASIEEVSVALPSEQVGAMQEAVDSGEYSTTSEIVQEAIRAWQQKRALCSDETELLRQLWDDGKASGAPRPLEIDRLIASAKLRVPE